MNVKQFVEDFSNLLESLDSAVDALPASLEFVDPNNITQAEIEKAQDVLTGIFEKEADRIRSLKDTIAVLFPKEEMLFYDLTVPERMKAMDEIDDFMGLSEVTAMEVLEGEESEARTSAITLLMCILDLNTLKEAIAVEAQKANEEE